MEEGTKAKKTIFVGGIGDDVDESIIFEAFQTFGASQHPHGYDYALTPFMDLQATYLKFKSLPLRPTLTHHQVNDIDLLHNIFEVKPLFLEIKHRGFAFVTYTSSGDAADAIDNMDGNELRGRVLRVNLARPQKVPLVGLGNRASKYSL